MTERLEERLVAIVERERHASRTHLDQIHALSIAERTATGESIAGLKLIRRGSRVIELECPDHHSRFREGDLLWLGDGDRPERGLEVVLRDIDPATARIRLEIDRFAEGDLKLRRDLVLDRRDLDLADREIRAIRASLREPRSPARRLLEGAPLPPDSAISSPIRAHEEAELDPDQAAALATACTRPLALVQGPPGAGKTRVAAAIVRTLVAAGKKVLVTAFTHRAVEQLLEAIVADQTRPLRVVKVGGQRGPEELAAHGIETVQSARALDDLLNLEVVGLTTSSAIRLAERANPASPPFDAVLIDEAGQVSLPDACAVLPLANRHVLVGDQLQLPPLTLAHHYDRLAGRSLFEHLNDFHGSLLLTRTYRMNSALCEFPSKTFYGGRLRASDLSRDRKLALVGVSDAILGPDPPAIIVSVAHAGATSSAPAEAKMAADIAVRAIASGHDPNEIAILAPHRSQGARIRGLLRAALPHLPIERQPTVDTVERLQGGERDLIILSLTTSDPDAGGSQGFLFSPNRLNVSLTRARKKLIVLMSPKLLDAYPDDERALFGAEIVRRLWRDLPRVEGS